MNLLPRDNRFFVLLQGQLSALCRASRILEEGLKQSSLNGIFQSLVALERQGDELLKQTILHLNETFITPFEREEVQQPGQKLDDVLDSIEETGFRLSIYQYDHRPPEIIEMAGIVRSSCECLRNAVQSVISGTSALVECERVAALESQADVISRHFLCELFQTQCEVVTLLKCKEIIQSLEAITDRCADVADIVEGISRHRYKDRERGVKGVRLGPF